MTETEWLDSVREHYIVLRHFVGCYHPVTLTPKHAAITADAAEAACRQVRESIKREPRSDMPVDELDNAISAKDVSGIMGLLQAAWFGVPESTSCWRIPGFREAVNLLDDPPDEGTQ